MRERGLKSPRPWENIDEGGRSREGAWIEILLPSGNLCVPLVAPVRERGLKSYVDAPPKPVLPGRSREGAWIEICTS